jgi:fermentation-respiration switch protein FrsA (DUF1100 family)
MIRGYDPVDFVADISPVPLLLIHSRDDHIVPHAFNDQLLQAARAPKVFYETSGQHTATFNYAENREYLLAYLLSTAKRETSSRK